MSEKIIEVIGKDGTKIYIVNLGNAYFVTPYKELADEVSKDVDKVFDKEFIKHVEGYEITLLSTVEEMKNIILRELNG